MPTRAKSRNDTKKEAAEEQCFKLALDAARRRGGGTYKIMSYLNGQNIDTRAKKDRPDLIRLCTNAKHEEVIVGIEHFCVNQKVEIQYATAEKAYFAQRDEALKINETVDEVFRLISEADTVVSRWKEALEKVKGIDTTCGWYTSLTTKLSDLSDKENIRMYIMKDFTDGTDTLRQLRAKRSETLREIEKNYTNVIANVESMKNAKTAVEYLEKLGFDLSALIEADNHPVTTALTVEVDTKFLFIGGEKK